MTTDYLTLKEASLISGENIETLKKRCQAGSIDGAIIKGKTWLIPKEYVLGERKLAGLYIDGANILHGSMAAGWLLDYDKVKSFLIKKYELEILSYYDSLGFKTGAKGKWILDETGSRIPKTEQNNFFNVLTGKGFRIVTKPLKFIKLDDGTFKPKNNMDSYLTLDALKESRLWDTFILFSGDSDFDRLVDDLIAVGKNIHIFSFQKRMSWELRSKSISSPQVFFTPLDSLKVLLERKKQA